LQGYPEASIHKPGLWPEDPVREAILEQDFVLPVLAKDMDASLFDSGDIDLVQDS
jgi:hypothetical protein